MVAVLLANMKVSKPINLPDIPAPRHLDEATLEGGSAAGEYAVGEPDGPCLN